MMTVRRVGSWGSNERDHYAASLKRRRGEINTRVQHAGTHKAQEIVEWGEAQTDRLDRLYLNTTMTEAEYIKLLAEIDKHERDLLNVWDPTMPSIKRTTLKKNPRRKAPTRSRLPRILPPAERAKRLRAWKRSAGWIDKPKKNPRRKFGRKRTLKSAVRKVREHVPQRYAICATVGGVKYFFNGRGFDTVGAHAASYVNRAFAAQVARSIRGVLPHKIKSLSVQPL